MDGKGTKEFYLSRNLQKRNISEFDGIVKCSESHLVPRNDEKNNFHPTIFEGTIERPTNKMLTKQG